LRERYATPGPHTAAHWGAELSEGYQATRGSVGSVDFSAEPTRYN